MALPPVRVARGRASRVRALAHSLHGPPSMRKLIITLLVTAAACGTTSTKNGATKNPDGVGSTPTHNATSNPDGVGSTPTKN